MTKSNNTTSKKWGRKLLITGAIAVTGGLLYVGEKTQPFTQLKEKIAFYNVGPAPSTPTDYNAWHVIVEKTKDLDAIVKITDDSTTYILNKFLGPITPEKQQEYLNVVGKRLAKDTPKDFFSGNITYQLNKEGEVEVLFGNKKTKQYWHVHSNWTAGDVGEQIDKFFEEMRNKYIGKTTEQKQTKQHLERIKKKAEESYQQADSLYQKGKKSFLEKKDSFLADSTKEDFWQKIKKNTKNAYEMVKERLQKK